MNIDEIKHLSWLARIELSNDELNAYEKQINKIIEYLNILDEADVEEEPSYIISSIEELRDDEPKESKDDAFSVVINKKDRFVKAPKMS